MRDGSNQHAADKLHAVRVEIKALETEVDELRSWPLAIVEAKVTVEGVGSDAHPIATLQATHLRQDDQAITPFPSP